MRLLVLLSDGFGGRGGIAQFNRDLLAALCDHPRCRQVVALPRVILDPPGPLPARLDFRTAAAGGKLAFARELARVLASGGEF
ncbi:MAG TPA: hypothetical protein VF771_09800, partial [Longimicrobiaceae bacterium]